MAKVGREKLWKDLLPSIWKCPLNPCSHMDVPRAPSFQHAWIGLSSHTDLVPVDIPATQRSSLENRLFFRLSPFCPFTYFICHKSLTFHSPQFLLDLDSCSFKKFENFVVLVCACVYMRVSMRTQVMQWYGCTGHRKTYRRPFSLSTMWVPRIEARLSDLVVSTLY